MTAASKHWPGITESSNKGNGVGGCPNFPVRELPVCRVCRRHMVIKETKEETETRETLDD